MKILFLHSNENMTRFISSALESEGFLIDNVFNQPKALCLSEARGYDLILVENNKKHINAIKFCVEVREIDKTIPMIMISSKYNIETRVEAFIIGFDDIVTKKTPFSEIHVRINGLIRRCSSRGDISSILKFDDLQIDTKRRETKRSGEIISLRRKEYDLLEYVMHYPEQVLSRHRLLEHVWAEDTFVYTNTVDVHMAALRRKVDKNKTKKLIHTVHGIGYMMSV